MDVSVDTTKKVGIFKNIYNTFLTNGKVQFIFVVLILLLIVNTILFHNDHFTTPASDSISSNIINGFYFTSTQFSTVGYGDISPKTHLAKFVCTVAQFIIVFLSLNIANEFGVPTPTERKLAADIDKVVQKSCSITPELKNDIVQSIVQKPIKSMTGLLNTTSKVNNVSKLIEKNGMKNLINIRKKIAVRDENSAQSDGPGFDNLEIESKSDLLSKFYTSEKNEIDDIDKRTKENFDKANNKVTNNSIEIQPM